ncbi:MAG: SOS response-associated peptidase [Bacteroidia bacterium]|nr:SOS response-associated peptidase [Bacteroidia bacterium]
MCGRYSLYLPLDKIALELGINITDLLLEPRYNAAPSQLLPVITNDRPHEIQLFRWGLIPFWAKDPSIGNKMINARSETVLEKPAFRQAMDKRRCLVLCDGFYEWKKSPSGKVPHHIRLKGGGLIALAGLWESWKDPEGREIKSFTILTTQANELVQPLHERMPVFLLEKDAKDWLNPEIPGAQLQYLFKPFPADGMEAYPVSTLLNSPRHDGPEVLIPDQTLF